MIRKHFDKHMFFILNSNLTQIYINVNFHYRLKNNVTSIGYVHNCFNAFSFRYSSQIVTNPLSFKYFVFILFNDGVKHISINFCLEF